VRSPTDAAAPAPTLALYTGVPPPALLAVGDSIPACEISTMGADGKLTKISTAELFPADGTTVMFGVPGAFTPG